MSPKSTRLHATEQGQGPPLALLHGLFGRSQNLGALARTLASHHRVISLDLRNHGASPHADGMSYSEMAEDVRETLASLGALPAALLGHSMGGKVAMMLALPQPEAVERLLVADIAPVAYVHHNAQVARALLALPLTPDLSRRAADAALSIEVPDAAVRGFLLQNFVSGPAPSWRIGLPQIAAGIADIEGWPDLPAGSRYDGQVLFLTAGASDYVLPEHWPQIARLFPKAEIVRLAGAGHWLHADQPGSFAATVSSFLSHRTGKGGTGRAGC